MSTRQALRRLLSAAVLLGFAAAAAACAMPHQREAKFEQAQRKYTQLVRWSAFHEAEEYVVPEAREAFLEITDALGGVRFMDYRIESLDFDAEANEATATVVYSAYRRSALAAISVEERQSWKRDNDTKAWTVRSTFVEKAFDPERRD